MTCFSCLFLFTANPIQSLDALAMRMCVPFSVMDIHECKVSELDLDSHKRYRLQTCNILYLFYRGHILRLA